MSRATTVDQYLKALPPPRRAALQAVRGWIRRAMPDAVENLEYGMPTYRRPGDGVGLFAIASRRHYLALHVCNFDVVERHRRALDGLDCGKSCIRFKTVDDLPEKVVRALLREAAREGVSVAPPPPAPEPAVAGPAGRKPTRSTRSPRAAAPVSSSSRSVRARSSDPR
jgi:uncharacterized protein YdhG (YjbR/CyaY superfamily)